MENKIYFVYQHIDLNGKTFYIGKGTKQEKGRIDGFDRAYSSAGRNNNWKIKAENGYKIEILKTFTNEKESLEYELLKINECEDCVNSQPKKNTLNYSIESIDNNVCKLIFLNSYYFLYASGCIANKFGKFLKTENNGRGYITVMLSCGAEFQKRYYLHRLIADAFIPNPENKPVVNHKDTNRSNNNFENLEWCTQKENIDHSNKMGNYKGIGEKQLLQLDYTGKIIKIWNNSREASIFFKCTKELIAMAARQNEFSCLSAKKFLWIYKEDYDSNNTECLNISLLKYKNGFNCK